MSFDTTILRDNAARQAAVARYMDDFITTRPHQERHSIVSEWIRYTHTTNSDLCFFIPFISDDDDETQGEAGDNDPLHPLKEWRVCKNAISVLLDYGIRKWQTCQEAILQNKLPTHGNKGKVLGKAKRFADHVKDDLHSFFQHIKQFGAPKATRFVREETGTGLRDGEDDLVELPTSWSKRAMNARFCFERGYVITTNARGSAIKTERSDANWRVEDQKMICSWWVFLVFWDTNYPIPQDSSWVSIGGHLHGLSYLLQQNKVCSSFR
jgi:hypothetical protein